MKTISAPLKLHLAKEGTTLCTCWKVTLVNKNNEVRGFSNHTRPLTFEGVRYDPASGYTPSAVETMSGLQVDNLEIEGMLSSDSISEDELMAGRWDGALVEIFQVNYLDLTMGSLKLRKGKLGEVRLGKHYFVAELRGLIQAYTKTIGELYSVTCRASFGDTRCKVVLTPYTFTTTVTSVVDNRNFTATGLTLESNYFDMGQFYFTTGPNAGIKTEIKEHLVGGVIKLVLPLPYPVLVGHQFTAIRGCMKSLTACKSYNNVLNFRGEPHLPGLDKVLTPGRR